MSNAPGGRRKGSEQATVKSSEGDAPGGMVRHRPGLGIGRLAAHGAAWLWVGVAGTGVFFGCDRRLPSQPEAAPTAIGRPVGPQLGDTMTNTIGIKLVYIAPGEFLMGSPESEEGRDDDEAQHQVRLTKGFYLGVTEVTQGQWQAVMGNNPSYFKGDANLPVERVSWDDAVAFCRKLSEREGKEYRLPTDAEWEYACRAGTTTRFSFGNEDGALCRYGNYCDRSNTDGLPWQDKNNNDGHDKTAPVGSFQPNVWGLYDMHGNVWEWCADWYEQSRPLGPVTDPSGPASGSSRVLRGGSWNFIPWLCRSAFRARIDPDIRFVIFGFRVACSSVPGLD